ncbi:MAG: beta-lactamase family protein [Acetatifactor sp.]|nr:beta-lactamase family protein [Acetatifactor sp.]
MDTLPSTKGEISPETLLALLDRLQQTHIPLHSLHILWHGRTELEAYYAPCRKGQLHRMFSISKSLTALAVLKLYETGRIQLEASICRYFPEYVDENTHPWIRQTTIRDMLMMRSCHASTTYKFDMTKDWVESYFTTPPTHKPGTVFHYDTSASHTLCALVEKLTGQPMLDYLKDTMLREIGWSEESYMLVDPFGHSMGGSGLMATAEDLVLLGRLLMQGGIWKGRALLREDLLAEAMSWQSATAVTGPITGERQGYGYFFWRGEQDALVCYGMGGQLVLCYPAHELLVVTTADTQGMNGANQLIYDAVSQLLLPGLSDSHSHALPREPEKGFDLLKRRVSRLCIEPLCSVYSQGCSDLFRNPGITSEDVMANAVRFLDPRTDGLRIHKQVYRIQNSSSFSRISLELSPESGILHYTLNGSECQLPFGLYQVTPCCFPGYDMF